MSEEKKRALGRGLDLLIPAARATASPGLSSRTSAAAAAATAPALAGETVREIPIAEIERNPYQTRGHMDDTALNELAASIKASGVLQPVVVRATAEGGYQLIAGERRWLASQRAGETTVPAIVRQVSNEQALEMTIIENLQREDLNALEQARAFERLSREFGMTQEQMSLRTGKERASIANYLRLLKMPEQIQYDLEFGALSFGHCKVLMMLNSAEQMLKCARRIEEQNLSVRQAEELVQGLMNPVERLAATSRPQDPNVKAAERELEQALGVKVVIKDRRGKGKIVIEYATLEDFDRVVEMLSKK